MSAPRFTHVTSWLLGGALLASLARSRPDSCPAEHTAGLDRRGAADAAAAARPEWANLGPDDMAALEALSARACGESGRYEARALRLTAELGELLADPEARLEDVRALVREIGAARTRAMELCVEGVFDVRELLNPQQVEVLLDGCSEIFSE